VLALADRLEATARHLVGLPGADEDWSLLRLARSLVMWSITVRRMAESGPASRLTAERSFPDHPEHGRSGEDPLAGHRAHVDAISFVMVGDLVLDDFAALSLEREALPAGDVPWRGLMRRLDDAAEQGEEDPRIRPARELDLILREARNRLVAHRRRSHKLIFGWQPDNTIQIELADPKAQARALTILRDLNSGLPVPMSGLHDYAETRDWILAFAGALGGADRKRISDAFRLAGFEAYSPERIVERVLALVATLEVAQEGGGTSGSGAAGRPPDPHDTDL